jgi:Type II CAAX prenyl endopeptidase Rce1-like
MESKVGAIAAAWLAFVAALLIGREVEDLASLTLGAAGGAALVYLGFAAAWRCRPLRPTAPANRARRSVLALAAGVALGLANLAANWIIANRDPTLRALLAERFKTLPLLEGLIASPVMEEVAVRLFLMSAVAWIASRWIKRPAAVFAIALAASALVFASLHLARPFPGAPEAASYYRAALMLKYTLSGLALGWFFWRWGLPYAILCHIVANGTHLVLQDAVFGAH